MIILGIIFLVVSFLILFIAIATDDIDELWKMILLFFILGVLITTYDLSSSTTAESNLTYELNLTDDMNSSCGLWIVNRIEFSPTFLGTLSQYSTKIEKIRRVMTCSELQNNIMSVSMKNGDKK